jgi:hypothetical protein
MLFIVAPAKVSPSSEIPDTPALPESEATGCPSVSLPFFSYTTNREA